MLTLIPIFVVYLAVSITIFVCMYRDIKGDTFSIESDIRDTIVCSILWPLLLIASPLDFFGMILDYVARKLVEYKTSK